MFRAVCIAAAVVTQALQPVAAQACRTDIPESASTWTVSGATATNTDTGLEVARCPVGQTWSGATCAGTPATHTWAQALQAASAAGNGWRLPNAKELDIVLDRRCMNPSVDTSVFPGATADRFWTSTPGWVIDQGEGTVIGSQTASTPYAVRLVRAGFSNASFQRPIAASGAVCRTDIPGDLNVADWTTGTNVTSGDMMTDTITGLVWQRCALGQTWNGSTCSGAGGSFTWAQALQAAKNAGAGWRLPNAKELDAMLDRRCASPAVNPTLFPGAQNGKAWTSTPGWAIDLTDGAVLGSQNALDANSVRLVKSGLSNANFERPIAASGAVCRTDIPGDLNVADWTTGTNVTSGDMMTDTITGLVWQRCALGQTWNGNSCSGAGNTFTWSQALVAARSAGNGWRLPNAKELDAMLDRRCASPAVNPTLFPGAQNGKVWTSTPGWAVDLTDGAVLGSQVATDTNAVRLVKLGASHADFERRIATAGAVCRTDIPGDLDVANWTPGANGTITDGITGLVWQRCALGQSWNGSTCAGVPGTFTWAQALQEANNAGAGWRLPNAKELDAMLDRRCTFPAVNPTLFPGAQNGKAWTSTPGWAVDLTDGAVLGSQNAADANSVRLVSAGYTYGPGNTVTDGACGTANGVPTSTTPTLNLCAAGSVSQFAGTGPWAWTCLGLNGGTPASCGAPKAASFELLMPQMLVSDVSSLLFPLAFIERPVPLLDVTCVSSNPLIVSVSGDKIYPFWGTVHGSTVTAHQTGTATITCNGVARVVTVIAPPIVNAITHDPAPLGQSTTFSVTGSGLLPNMEFRVGNCVGDSIEVNLATASSTLRSFRCVPSIRMSGLYDFRVRGSKINLAANYAGGFEPLQPLSSCVEESEEFGRLRRDFGRNGVAGARYGDVDFEGLNWEDLKNVSTRLRNNSVCHQDNTAEQNEAIAAQTEALRLERENNLGEVLWKAKAEVFKSDVKILASGAELVADVLVVGAALKSARAALKAKNWATWPRRLAKGLGRYYTPSSALLKKIERLDRVAGAFKLGGDGLTLAADLLSDADRADMLQDTVEAVSEGYLEDGMEQVAVLRAFLNGGSLPRNLVRTSALHYMVALDARLGVQLSSENPQAWSAFIANEGLELVSQAAGLVPVAGPLYDIWKESQDGLDAVNRAFDGADIVYKRYDEKADAVLRRALSMKLTDKFLLAEYRAIERARTLVADRNLVEFGVTAVGDAKSLALRLTNRGTRSVEVVSIEVDGEEITHAGATCTAGSSILAGGQCDLSIVMNATTAARLGAWTDELRLHFRDNGLPYVLRVIARGNVVDGRATQTRTATMSSAYASGETHLIVGSSLPNSTTTCIVERTRMIDALEPLFGAAGGPSPPAGVGYPFGFVDFGLSQCQPGATARITVRFPYDLPPAGAIELWKKTATGYIRFGQPGAPATFTVIGREVTYDVVDGGVGDLDGVANGSILDPVGIGLSCNLDLNGDGQITANEDGLLAARYLAGFRGSSLTAGIPLGAGRPTFEAVANGIGTAMRLDVFGRGDLAATMHQDGMVIVRLMQQFSDENLLRGIVVPTTAMHVEASAIRRTVNERCGTQF